MRPQDKERIQVEVVSRIVDRAVSKARSAPDAYLETLLNDTLYHEKQRLDREDPAQPMIKQDLAFYAPLRKRISRASATDQQAMLESMARHFVEEVTGNFDQRVYQVATRAIPTGLTLLMGAMSPWRMLQLRDLRAQVADQLVVQGELEHIRKLADRGTLVVVPTHSSNLDSIVLGYAWHLVGMDPLCYGAGLNLFNNPMLSFFMHNLGAYKVDRKKKAALYKEVLKEYATCSMEMGYDNLFFPGGTRSRSGKVEQKLKKGLLGCALRAYVGNLRSKRTHPNIYIVPCTLSYKLVLEGETLVGDHLKAVGKSRYIIEDDEFSKPRRILNFFSNLVSLDSKLYITFSEPLDVFGNRVDQDGNSLDPRGRSIDASRYVLSDGRPVHDDQRDRQYTIDTAAAVTRALHRDNVLSSTNVVALALYRLLQQANPGIDAYRLLRTGGGTPSFPMSQVHAETSRLLEAVRIAPDAPRLGDDLRSGDVPEIVGDALKHFSIYHTHPAARRRGDRVFHEDRNLLLYYGNRLRGYDLGRTLKAG
jgi:glycerol-3-phosphate O-acyltransferase